MLRALQLRGIVEAPDGDPVYGPAQLLLEVRAYCGCIGVCIAACVFACGMWGPAWRRARAAAGFAKSAMRSVRAAGRLASLRCRPYPLNRCPLGLLLLC